MNEHQFMKNSKWWLIFALTSTRLVPAAYADVSTSERLGLRAPAPAPAVSWNVASAQAPVAKRIATATPTNGTARPFPAHAAYARSVLKPSISQTQMDAATRNFYNQWKALYLKTIGNQNYILHDDSGATNSEAHGYGMMILLYMAGADPNAKKLFDGMVRYYQAHPSSDDPTLMAWKQLPAKGQMVDISDHGSATDGDLDIAYALLMADKQWGSSGAINYKALGIRMTSAIMKLDVNHTYMTIGIAKKNGARPSDFMPDHLRVYQAATGDRRWTQMLKNHQALVRNVVSSYSPNTGLMPDFLILTSSTTGHPAPANYYGGPDDMSYSWNANRDPWRVATDMAVNGDMTLRPQMVLMNNWLKTAAGGNPSKIKAGYTLSGSPLASYSSMAFTAPFMVGAMAGGDQSWLNKLWAYVAGQPPSGYYADSLKLLSMLVTSGNWWR